MFEQYHEKTGMPLIIENTIAVPLSIRLGWGLVAVFFWILWIYLWMPLSTLGAWILSFSHIHHNVWAGRIKELEHLSITYLLIILLLGSCLLLWALSQYVRFRNASRRLKPLAVHTKELAAFSGLTESALAKWQHEQWLTVHHDEHGKVVMIQATNNR